MTDDRIVAITMPKWGLSMQVGKIIGWIVAEGDDIDAGSDVADIETDKIAGTLEAPSAGTVRRFVARVGEDVPVGATIALLAPDDVTEHELDDVVGAARVVIEAGVPHEEGAGPVLETAEADGRKISYAGIGDDGDVVLLIHGYGGDRNSWLFVQQPLADQHRVYALDLPGHGTSSKDVGDGSLTVLAGAVVSVLDAIGADHAHLVGHSLGGAVAVEVAARDPGRIASLTLIAPAGFGAEINTAFLRGFADAQTRRELRPVVGQLFADDSMMTRQVVDDLLAYKRLDGVDAALHSLLTAMLDGERQRISVASQLSALGNAVPVTVIWGSADRIIPAEQASSAPGADRHVLHGAGHMPHMEKPTEVLEVIRARVA